MKRILSIVLSVCLILQAIQTSPSLAQAYPVTDTPLLNPLTLKLPASLGSVKEVFDGKSSKVVFLIQDAHAIPDAQKSIQKLIEHIERKYQVPLVALEGAASPLDPLFFKTFPDQPLLRKIFDSYLNHAEISGSTAAALFSSSSASYYGIEDWPIYEEGLKFFLTADQNQPQIERQLDVLFDELNRQKENSYSKKLLEIDKSLNAFNKNSSDLVSTLQKLASVQPPEHDSDLALLLQETAMSGVPDLNLETEIQKIAAAIQQALERSSTPSAREDLRSYHQNLQDYKTSQMAAQAFALHLKNLARKYRIHVMVSKKLNALVRHQKKLKDIEGTRLFEHYEKYQQTVKAALFRNENEKSLDRRSRQLDLLTRLSRLELSSQDWQEIKGWLSSKDYWNVTRDGISGKDDIAGLLEIMQANLSFYRNAETRDRALHENTRQLMARHKASMAVLIAGGFHAEGLRQRFQAEGISYVLIMPAIEEIPEKTNYRESMRGEVSWKSYFQIKNGKINLHDAFLRATRDQLLTAAAASNQPPLLLKNWRDQIIRELANQGRTDHAGEYTDFLDELHHRTPDKLLTQWEDNINRFFSQLHQLKTQDQLTEKAILRLLSPAALTTPYSIPFARSELRLDLIHSLLKNTIRSEVRSASQQASVKTEPDESQNYLQSGLNFDRTLPVYQTEGIFIETAEQNGIDQRQNIRSALDGTVAAQHENLRLSSGYLGRNLSPEVNKIYEIFERVVKGYNRVAKARDRPSYLGKLFLVDSEAPNAFVFSEHDDVYQNIGDIRETTRYLQVLSAETGTDIPLTEELIAVTFAHELAHILQGSSYEGLAFSKWKEKGLNQAVIMDLKRRMEFDADRVAISILDEAGYGAESILTWLDFMIRITPEGTAQHSMKSHPHPKLRLASIDEHRYNATLSTRLWDESIPHGPNFEKGVHVLDKNRYAVLETAHTHHHAHLLNTFADIDNAAATAQSPQQLLEYAALADEKASLATMKAFAETDEVRNVFAKQIYMQNVVNIAEQMLLQAQKKDIGIEVTVEGQATPLNALLLSQNLKAGAHLLTEISSLELGLWVPGKAPLSPQDRQDLERRAEKTINLFKENMEAIMVTVQNSELSSAKKNDLMQKLLLLVRDSIARLPSIQSNNFETNLAEAPANAESLLSDFMSPDAERSAKALETLAHNPLSVYSHYGKTTLDRAATLAATPFGDLNQSLGGLQEEIEDSGFYRPDPALSNLQTLENRRTAYQTSLYAWTYDRMAQKIKSPAFQQRHLAHFTTLIDQRLENKNFYARNGDADLAQKKAQELFEIFFLHGWEAFLEKFGKQPEVMDFFRDAALEADLTDYEKDGIPSRSQIYSHENGLNRPPKILLKKSDPKSQPNRFVYNETTHGSGRRPRKYYEISGNSRGAANAIGEDYKIRRILHRGINLPTLLEVLDEHLAVYSPYFRVQILNHLIPDLNSSITFNPQSYTALTVLGTWFRTMDIQEIHDWVEKKVSAGDAQNIMRLFLEKTNWGGKGPEEIELMRVETSGDDFKPLSLEKAREVCLYIEKYFITGRLEDKRLISKQLAQKYLSAKLSLYQYEKPDQGPPADALYQDLLRLSVHIPITVTHRNISLADPRHPPDALDGHYSRQELSNPELFEQRFSAMLFHAPRTDFEADYFRQLFSFSREQLQKIASNQNSLARQTQKKAGRFTAQTTLPAFFGKGRLIKSDEPSYSTDLNLEDLLSPLILRRILQEESPPSKKQKFQPVLVISRLSSISKVWIYLGHLFFRALKRMLILILKPFLYFLNHWIPLSVKFFLATRFGFYRTTFTGALSSVTPANSGIELSLWNPTSSIKKAYRFQRSTAIRRFFEKMSEGFIQSSKTDKLLGNLSQSWSFLKHFFIFSPLLTDTFIAPEPKIEASINPISYLKYLARQVKAGGVKSTLFKTYAQRRKLLDLAGPLSPGERAVELGKTLESPSTTRDGILDVWERTLAPEIHRYSAISRGRLARISRPSWFLSHERYAKRFDDFLSDGLIEVPPEWENLATQSLKMPLKRALALLEFYRQAIPLIMDPQRQLRYGATAMKIWRVHKRHFPGFLKELQAIEDFFPKPSRYRDQQLDILLENNEIPIAEKYTLKNGQQLDLDVYTERLKTTYQRLEYDEELTHADAIYQVVQSTLSVATRKDRKDILLWFLNPKNPLPGVFQSIKAQKNIEFDDLPRHLKHMPQILKQEVLGLLLTGENGLLNSRLPKDRAVKREFSEAVFDYFFPPHENDPVKTGIPSEDLELMREIFVTSMDHFDQGRAALMIQDMMAMQNRLEEMAFGERLAFLLSSFGPVGVKIGQFLAENQQLIPSVFLRGYLASLRDNTSPIGKLAVLKAIESSGIPRHRVRLKKMLGSASMKVVYDGEYLNDAGNWVPVVFKVLRPSIGRMTAQDLAVLEKTLKTPSVLEKIKKRFKDFDPDATVAAIRKMINAERDFEMEAKNEDLLRQAVASDPAGPRDERGYAVSVPKIWAVKKGLIIEEKAQGIEIGKFLSLRTGWKRFFGGSWLLRRILSSRGLAQNDIGKISEAAPADIIRSLRQRFLHQIFTAGIFHADPHGGNVILGPATLHFIDPGLIGHFNDPAKWIRTNLDQRDAARQLMKAVLIQDAALVIQSVSQMIAAEGGHLAEPLNSLEIRVILMFKSTRGNPGQFLNDLAAFLMPKIQGGGDETFSRFVKAISQGLWMFPMDPLQGWDTLQDLKAVLPLSPADLALVKQHTIKPYLVKNYLNPRHMLKNLKNRVTSFLAGIYRSFKRRWERLILMLDMLRLRRQMRELSNLLTTSPPSPSEKSVSPAAPVVLVTFDKDFKMTGPAKIEQEAFKKIEAKVSEAQRAQIHEAAVLHAHYAALITRGHLYDPHQDGISNRAVPSYDSLNPQENNFHWVIPSLNMIESVQLDLLDPFPINFWQDQSDQYLQRSTSWSTIAETLTRRFLEKKYGADAIDFSVFNEGLGRYLADQLTDLYLTQLDILDETRGPLTLKNSDVITRRDMLFQRFQDAAPISTPILKLPGSHANIDTLNVPVQLNSNPSTAQIVSSLPVVRQNTQPTFLKDFSLRDFLKTQVYALREPGSHLLKKNQDILILAQRNLYSYDRTVKTIHLELYSIKDSVQVSVDLTESEYHTYLTRGSLPKELEVTHYESQQAPTASRSEMRLASQASQSLALQLMPPALELKFPDAKLTHPSADEAAAELKYLVRSLTFSGARRQTLFAAQETMAQLRKGSLQKTGPSEKFARAQQQSQADLLKHLSKSGDAARDVLLSIAFRTKVKKGAPFLTALNLALRAYGNPVEFIAEKEFFNTLPQTTNDRKNRIQKQIRHEEWKKHIVLRSEQDEAPLADDGPARSDVLAEMFTGFFLDLSGTTDVLTSDFAQLLYAASLIELAKIYNDPQHKSEFKKLALLKASPLKKAEYLRNALLQNLAELNYSNAMFSFQNGRLTLVGKAIQSFLARAEVRKSA